MTMDTFARVGLVLVATSFSGHAVAASFTRLGAIDGQFYAQTDAWSVSDDGSQVVGGSVAAAYRWTAATGFELLTPPPYTDQTYSARDAWSQSADGSVIVGSGSTRFGATTAYRWTPSGGATSLGVVNPFGGTSAGRAVSANGEVIVGFTDEAFRWTAAGGIVGLGDLPGGTNFSQALAVSADGSVVVGAGSVSQGTGPSYSQAFRWTAATGMVGLPDFYGNNGESFARGISDDGAVIVGQASAIDGFRHAFRWTQATGMVGIGPAGSNSLAIAASADGSMVVGTIGLSNGNGASYGEAFIWTQAGGMQRLLDVLLARGVTPDLAELGGATDISADGRFIVGYGYNGAGGFEGFLVDMAEVPLPAAIWAFLAGCIAVLPAVKRRNRVH